MTLIGQAVLLQEGMRARRAARGETGSASGMSDLPLITAIRRVGMMGGLLIGLSTFQAEFDFGVPQFRFIFQPMLIMLAAGIGLVAVRQWLGRGAPVRPGPLFLSPGGGPAPVLGAVLRESAPPLPLLP